LFKNIVAKSYEKIIDGISKGFINIKDFNETEIDQIIIDALTVEPNLPLIISLFHNKVFELKELLENIHSQDGDIKIALSKIKEKYPTFYNDLAFLAFSIILLKITDILKQEMEVK